MYRVTWYVGRTYYFADYHHYQDGHVRANDLIAKGFYLDSKAGVRTFYPPHRISKITLRLLKGGAK